MPEGYNFNHITREEYEDMRTRGLSRDEIISLDQAADKKPKDFLNIATNIVNKIFPGKKIGEAIGTEAAKLGVTGLTPKQRRAISPGPTTEEIAGDILQAGTLIGGTTLPIAGSIAGKAAQFGILGAAGGAGEKLIEGGGIKETIGGAIKGGLIGAGIGTTFGVAEKGFKALGAKLGKIGEKIQTTIIKPTKADIEDGFSIKTVNKYNLGGSLKSSFEKTDTLLDDLAIQLNKKISTSKNTVDLNNVYENTAKRVLGNKLQSFGANQSIDRAIENLRNEIVSVSGENGLVNIPDAQIIKRASGHFGAWLHGIPDPESTARQRVYNIFYNELKNTIEKESPFGVKEINKQISELIPVMNALIRRIPVAERNATISLTDIITLTGASFEPRALGLTLLNLASKSGIVGEKLAKFAPKTGKIIEKGIQKVEPIARFIMSKK